MVPSNLVAPIPVPLVDLHPREVEALSKAFDLSVRPVLISFELSVQYLPRLTRNAGHLPFLLAKRAADNLGLIRRLMFTLLLLHCLCTLNDSLI